jgi:hypothetical protein
MVSMAHRAFMTALELRGWEADQSELAFYQGTSLDVP